MINLSLSKERYDKAVAQAKEIIRQFGKEESIPRREVSAAIKALETMDFKTPALYQIFVGFDALGCCQERDDFLDRFYVLFKMAWALRASKESIK